MDKVDIFHANINRCLTLLSSDEVVNLDQSEKLLIWRGSPGDLATDIGEFLSEIQIQELILELSSEYQKKKREKLRNESK